MEYCQLSDLSQFMKKRTQLPSLPETQEIFAKYPNAPNHGLNEVVVRHFVKQIASAVEYLRARNLIHRDVKPQNLLLNPAPLYMQRQKPEDVPLAASEHSLVPAVGLNSLPMLKIADFGFARHLPQMDMAETLCGSPLYMAPEILSYQKYDAKADLWSVGAVTYEMMVGRPPFRASNHIDLLRKIDQAMDVIPFPKDLVISSELKRTIRYLLKRQPTERLSFESFFKSPPVVDDIPGVVGEDLPRTANVTVPDPGVSELSRRMQKQSIDAPAQSRHTPVPSPKTESYFASHSNKVAAATNRETRRASAEVMTRNNSTGNVSRPMDIHRPNTNEDARRPQMVAHATAPAREYLVGEQYSRRNTAGLERRSSRAGPAPSSSAPREATVVEQARPRADRASREDRDRAAQDLAFEREYVVVEKRTVEVNAFADELAANTHMYSGSRNAPLSAQHGAMVRRATSQATPTSTTGAQPASPSSAMQAASGRRPDGTLHVRNASYDKKTAPSTSVATAMLSKALNAASARTRWFPGFPGNSPPVDVGPSPPRGFPAFPMYPTPTSGLAITNGTDVPGTVDENEKMLNSVEDIATRSDTVFSFAEVKYYQLVPATPSADEGQRMRQIGALEHPIENSGEEKDEALTQAAVVAVSEEALVLYVKALGILSTSMNLANIWWRRYTNGEFAHGATGGKMDVVDIGKRMNNVVQWARNRFNECCQKSEVVARRLVEAQKQLPVDHPGHPNNHEPASGTGSESANNVGISAENFYLSTGVTAEGLMYERALEMSKNAAINELVGENLGDCELSYRTAIILFEAVLEDDDDTPAQAADATEDQEQVPMVSGLPDVNRKAVVDCKSHNVIVYDDRDSVLTFPSVVEGVKNRLKSLIEKIHAQAVMQKQNERRVSTGAMKPGLGASPSPTTIAGTSPR